MSDLPIFKNVLRTRDGSIYALTLSQDFYFMRSPKLIISITNQTRQGSDGGSKSKYAKMYLDVDKDGVSLIRKLRQGVAHNRSSQERMELCKYYKGGKDYKRKYGVDVISRIFTMSAEKGRIFLKIEISKGEQKQTRNKSGQSVPGVVKPAGGSPIETVSYALSEDAALDLAFMLEKEYAAWRCALNTDFLYHPQKYSYRPDTQPEAHDEEE